MPKFKEIRRRKGLGGGRKDQIRGEETEGSETLIRNEGILGAGARVLQGPHVLVSNHSFIHLSILFSPSFPFFPRRKSTRVLSACCIPAAVLGASTCFIHFILDVAVAELKAV